MTIQGVEMRLYALLQRAKSEGLLVQLWWRDDDACTITEPLTRLIEMQSLLNVPLSLAVIPRAAQLDLVQAVASPQISILQHGWAHAKQQRLGERNSEFGDHRPMAQMLQELDEGRTKMEAMFRESFHPVLVPPWNRIGSKVSNRRDEIGLPWLSVFGPKSSDDSYVVNTHIDIIDWSNGVGLKPEVVLELFCDEVSRLIECNLSEPIGLLTHHLQHDELAWATLEVILNILANDSNIAWPTSSRLFPPIRPERNSL